MRSLKELLIVLLFHTERLMSECKLNRGLCAVLVDMYEEDLINKHEWDELEEYIKDSMPVYYNDTYYPGIYGWEPSNTIVRIEWLEQEISKL